MFGFEMLVHVSARVSRSEGFALKQQVFCF